MNAKVHTGPDKLTEVLWEHTSSSVCGTDETVSYFWNMIVITIIQKHTSKINKYNYGQLSKEVVGKSNKQQKSLESGQVFLPGTQNKTSP